MSDSTLSFASSSNFRDILLARNLQPYSVPGSYSPSSNSVNYETNLSVANVIDSPNGLISTNQLADSMYSLNEYGPEGGYDGKYSVPGAPLPVDSNSGPYAPTDTVLDLVNEFYIDAAYVQNIYGPEGGYKDLVIITDVVGNPKMYTPYWDPSTFVTSSYSPYEIIFSNNPNGTNGPLSQDTYLAKIGAAQLKSLFEERIASEILQASVGSVNLDSLQDPFSASMVATGKQPFFTKNWRITVPENPISASVTLANRLTGTYFPVSFIPGDYFDESFIDNPQTEAALNVANNLTGGFLGPILNKFKNPSEIFVANTGFGQRSVLFSSLDYNKYRPAYSRGIIQGATTAIDRLFDQDKAQSGGYYVGSPNSEPSQIDSPANQVPIGKNGRQVQTIVYGPQELGILYEGNESQLQFGLKGKSYTDGGGIDGQFVWTSPKYKDNAGFKVGPGGVPTRLDNEFETIKSDYGRYQSTDIDFKGDSILDKTQRIIDSADQVQGQARLKHVGNAINQVSKVFNDGYKEMTKGSMVLSYTDQADGSQAGIEYCRVFQKDTPYFTYADLQKSDGITTEGRKFSYSVLDKTYNLNIAPLKNPGSTNIVDNKVKKYMFSIENLAWRTSDRPGFTYDDLPVCEKGPNGGRVMWFPPYDISFSDDSTPDFSSTNFLGRPEPIYTYKNTSRKGSISWKIVVDHPAIMNTIIQKQLAGVAKQRVDSIVDSFFAGCTKYDMYELGIKFNTIPTRDLFTYQQILNNPRLTNEELGQVAFEIPVESEVVTTGNAENGDGQSNSVGGTSTVTNSTSLVDGSEMLKEFLNYAFYFENDCPECYGTYATTSSKPFDSWYDSYIPKQSTTYVTKAPATVYVGSQPFTKEGVQTFFNGVIKQNFDKLKKEFLEKLKEIIIDKKGTVELTLRGSASAPAKVGYNKNLSQRRVDSVQKWFNNQKLGDKLISELKDQFKIVIQTQGEEEVVTVGTTDGGNGTPINCTTNITTTPSVNPTGGDIPGASSNSSAQWYSVPAMACRRVALTNIKVMVPPEPTPVDTPVVTTDKTTTDPSKVEKPGNTSNTIKPTPNLRVEQKIKEGISKKILRFLFSECDYFEVIKESDPMIYDSIKQKIKYFNPAFHSTTPEGLNARLTFLNQCVRPGQTIPVIGPDGRPKYNDALNTSFGAPPILILRMGDFYHSKIVPTSLGITYDPITFDLNPEGIGVQPMIAKITLAFNFIGGHGLKEPVEELQNALSFNYYANTEIYDERATATESTEARDKYMVEKILSNQPKVTTANVVNQEPKKGGEAIGTISGDTDIDYTKFVNDYWNGTKEYFDTFINTNAAIGKNYNIGILDLLYTERDYSKGTVEFTPEIEVPIYGKPSQVEDKLEKLFNKVNTDISQRNDPFMLIVTANDQSINNSDKREIENKLKEYVTGIKPDFITNVSNSVKDLVLLQQNYIQYIRKANLVLSKTDGIMNSNNEPDVYDISGDTFTQLQTYLKKITDKHIEFNEAKGIVMVDDCLYLNEEFYKKIPSTFIDGNTSDSLIIAARNTSGLMANEPANRFYQVVANILNDENSKNELRTFILNSQNYSSVEEVTKVVDKAIVGCSDRFNPYTEINKKRYDDIKNKEKYLTLIKSPIEDNIKFGLKYTKVSGTSQQKKDIKELYSNVNVNNKEKTFDGKIKFN
jgi:outer membrane protein OmpA-like peptidoglycan-associated protein